MRILVKILLSFIIIVISGILQAIISESGNQNTGFVRLIPGAVMIFGIIGVWRYKPSKKESSDKDLDKTP